MANFITKHFKRAKNKVKSAVKKHDLDGIDPKVYARRWWILGAMCLTLLGAMLANSSLNMALPVMAADLSLDQLQLTWIVNVYTLVFASLLLLSGAVGDRYGRKLAMQIGLAIFLGGSVYAGFFAQTGTELIIARAIMGIGGAFVMPTTLSIINNTFPKGERARAVAIWGAVAGVGMMVGSVISGVLLEHFTWHAPFLFSAAIALVGLIINHILVQESKDEEGSPVDWVGGVFSTIGFFGLVYGVTEAPAMGLHEPSVIAALIIGPISLLLFVLWELRAKFPMLDMRLFKNRGFSVSSLTLTLAFLAMSGVFFALSQLIQLIMGYSAFESSLAMIPLMLPMMIVSPFIPNLVKKIGARNTVTIGLALTAAAFVVMSTWTASMTYWHLFFTMAIMMLGISAAMTPGTNILMASVPRNRSGMGSAMNDTTRELGSALGVAVLGAILTSVYTSNISETANAFTGAAKEGIESSLAVALAVSENLGPAATMVADAAKTAFMDGLSSASVVASVILFIASIIAYFGLPKHKKQSDTI